MGRRPGMGCGAMYYGCRVGVQWIHTEWLNGLSPLKARIAGVLGPAVEWKDWHVTCCCCYMSGSISHDASEIYPNFR